MKTKLFIMLFVTIVTSITTSAADTTVVDNSTANISVYRNGHKSVVDSITTDESGQTVIFIDGIKTPLRPSAPTAKKHTPSNISPSDSVKDSNKDVVSVKKASSFWLSIIMILICFLAGISLIVYAIRKKSNHNTESKKVNNNLPLFSSKLFSLPENKQLKEDNRMDFVPVVNPNHAPAYPNMPTRDQLNPAALPSMVATAYTNLPNFVREHGVITSVTHIKHGVLNGRFSMEHADGTVSTQEFRNEPGFRAKAKFANGKTMLIYSRYSCLNNVRVIKIAEVLEQPSFTPETEVKTTKNSTTTTVYRSERIAS